jgi:hypothetical protein
VLIVGSLNLFLLRLTPLALGAIQTSVNLKILKPQHIVGGGLEVTCSYKEICSKCIIHLWFWPSVLRASIFVSSVIK